MNKLRIFALISIGFGAIVSLAQAPLPSAEKYDRGPDSLPQPGVPKGELLQFELASSRVYPGTKRKIEVYIPAEYRAEGPACVYIGLDGLGFEAPTVFDNLIFKHELPVTIAIGIEPGSVESVTPAENPRFDRSYEFDSLSSNLATFVLDEVIPEVEKHKTAEGLPILLSADPNSRAVGGASTGGIGAFTLAWERPDSFRRVFTAIGTFVGMRGGDRYPVLVRKTEPKPIRIFMVDGSNDEWMGGPEVGDWWMSNQTMERALEFAGYQVQHLWGDETHDDTHATAVFPDAMRWLWKDWPQPIRSGVSQNTFLTAILKSNEEWHVVPGDYSAGDSVAVDTAGALTFRKSDGTTSTLSEDGELVQDSSVNNADAILSFGPDGRAYLGEKNQVIARATTGALKVVVDGVAPQQVIVTNENRIYITEDGKGDGEGKLWLVEPNRSKRLLDSKLGHPTGVALSPDGLWLAVAEGKSHWGYSYKVEADGTVQNRQRFYWFHVPDTADDSGVTSWVMDRDGRLYASTRMGVQVFDRNGRVRAILPVSGGRVLSLAFGGRDFSTLYAVCADHKVYYRKLGVRGAPSWAAHSTLPPWGAG